MYVLQQVVNSGWVPDCLPLNCLFPSGCFAPVSCRFFQLFFFAGTNWLHYKFTQSPRGLFTGGTRRRINFRRNATTRNGTAKADFLFQVFSSVSCFFQSLPNFSRYLGPLMTQTVSFRQPYDDALLLPKRKDIFATAAAASRGVFTRFFREMFRRVDAN